MTVAGRPLLALHGPGDALAGAPWRRAFEASAWDGPVLAPDLPGHGDEPAPAGGDYELFDAAFAALRCLAASRSGSEAAPVVLGVGVSGWAAQVLALGDRAAAVVLVDGLGGPWTDAAGAVERGRRLLRALADDPAALAPAPPSGLDPRLWHGVPSHGSRRLAERAAAAMPVPSLLLETPGSPVAGADAEDLAGRFPAGATLRRITDAAPDTVAREVVAWVAALPAAIADGTG